MASDSALTSAALGDIVVLPDARQLTVRSRVALPAPVGSLAGFVLAGELELLLGVPDSVGAPIGLYLPCDYRADPTRNFTVRIEGATNYYAPHLPALRGAMGELLFRVVAVSGSVDPLVLIYRGEELIVFVRAGLAEADSVLVRHLRRDSANDVDVVRHACRVLSDSSALTVPDELLRGAFPRPSLG